MIMGSRRISDCVQESVNQIKPTWIEVSLVMKNKGMFYRSPASPNLEKYRMDQNQIDASPSDARTRTVRPALVYGATHKTRFLARPNCLLDCPRFHPPRALSMGALRSRTTGKPKWQSRPSKMDVLSRELFEQPPIPSRCATSALVRPVSYCGY